MLSSKRNLIIIGALTLAIVLGSTWFFFFRDGPDANKEGDGGFLSSLFPGSGDRNDNQNNINDDNDLTDIETKESATKKLVSENISGAILLKNPSTSSGRIRYIERGTGHVYEIDLDGGNKKKISNTTIPGIFDVIFSTDGSRAILKYISNGNLNIFSAKISSTTEGIFLPSNIKDIVFSPKGDRILYSVPNSNDNLLVAASPENKNQKTFLKNPFGDWRINWVSDNNIYLANAPSAFNDGFLYRLNIAAGALEKMLGPKLGLQITSDGANVLFSESDRDNRTILSSILNIKSGKITPLDFKIIPEKCVWSRKEKNALFCGLPAPFPEIVYPDDWYQGKVSFFTDTILKINIVDMTAAGFEIEDGFDIVKPFLSEDESALFFVNRNDGSLWRANLK